FGDRACGRPAAAGTVRQGDCTGRSPLLCADPESLVPCGAPSAHAADPFPAAALAAEAGRQIHNLGMDRPAAPGPAGIFPRALLARHPAPRQPRHAPPVPRRANHSRAVSRVDEIPDSSEIAAPRRVRGLLVDRLTDWLLFPR